ncbi:response regulator transcription factor [Micromonospora sp. WMMD882]|uniref:LuxR C-terminal-related transcriptional regulator n=1 Tax=Micromonospora sp. WMMD882 TaxID=3015151 RepID=UPI00248C7AEE|nr:response regulator transcription factor [Micromonospora sp. WMMD882]WBB79712.1 response regulator transcription factor [Micromonospora sp. WMMD882]
MAAGGSPLEPGRARGPRRDPVDRHLAVVPSAGGTADPAIRVAVLDDQPVFRLGLTAVLDALPDLGVVAAADDVDGVVAVVARHRPDVVVLDLTGGGAVVAAAVRAVLARLPGVGVLVVSGRDDPESVVVALRAGARGYLHKGAGPAELERAVRAVAHGEVLLASRVAARAVERLCAGRVDAPPPFPELTGRERQVLDLVAQGLGNVLVARRLSVSPKTVRNHLSNVLHKLQATDRGQAIRLARRAGLGRL